MKFGTIIKQKMLYQMTPRLSQSDVAFKVKLKVKLRSINGLEFELKSNARLE